MHPNIRPCVIALMLVPLALRPAASQTRAPDADPLVQSMQDGAQHVRAMFTLAAEQMSEEDFAFKPTPEVRSFGQLLAHVAETNYGFCAAALGEKAPVAHIEKGATDKATIQKALLESFTYCDRAFAAMNDRANAIRMVSFHGGQRTAAVLLNFRNYHSLLHWGNAITYMRLRGKVPPSAG
ncbi:MAG TPA: DinB family protein [Longimicrobiales bacterium]|nr:DinB family protein [Longimicrobiales bacterium]